MQTKKPVKLNYVGFWPGFDPSTFLITQFIEKNYDVQISQEPDFILCSCLDDHPNYLDHPQPRIMYSGENYIPDLNLVDYAISPYPVSLLDRCFRFPHGLLNAEKAMHCYRRTKGEIVFDRDFLKSKTSFANFCASHDSEGNLRGDFFKQLCQYKTVDSIGSFLNNTGAKVKFNDGTKAAYQRKCKFSLCFESTSHGGFSTEKIVDAFYSDTIPVYYGDPYIGELFNKKAFINVADFDSFDDAIARIIELDNDDEAYLEMLNQPVFTDPEYYPTLLRECEAFICHIFDQQPEKAYRRSRVYAALHSEQYLKNASKAYRAYLKYVHRFNKLIGKFKPGA